MERQMKKILFYAMTGEVMCFQHILLNALDLSSAGHEIRIIFEGASVTLPPVLEEKANPLYRKAKQQGLIAGICLACSKALEVYQANEKTGLPFLSDMNGHAGMKSWIDQGYEVISM